MIHLHAETSNFISFLHRCTLRGELKKSRTQKRWNFFDENQYASCWFLYKDDPNIWKEMTSSGFIQIVRASASDESHCYWKVVAKTFICMRHITTIIFVITLSFGYLKNVNCVYFRYVFRLCFLSSSCHLTKLIYYSNLILTLNSRALVQFYCFLRCKHYVKDSLANSPNSNWRART